MVALASALSPISWARSYHVSNAGDDTQAGSVDKPWKTLAKVAATDFQPGDSILLERGSLWRETLVLRSSGTEAAPLVVAPYGQGSVRPQILGSESLAGVKASGIRSATVPGGALVKMVAIGDWRLPVSRVPDTGWVEIGSIQDDTTLVLQGAAASIDWTGASVHLRTSPWTLETHRVRSSTAGRVVLSGKLVSRADGKPRVFFSNHAAGMSTSRPTWYQSAADGLLRWSDPGDSLAVVEAAIRPRAIDLGNRSFVQLRGLGVYGSTEHGILSSGTGVQAMDLVFRYPGLVGAQLDGAQARIASCVFVGSANNGVVGHGVRAVVQSNVIRETALLEPWGPDGMGDGCCGGHGIAMNGDSTLIRSNELDRTGYNGITFVGKATRVEDNVVNRSCSTTDDCAGIYTIAGTYGNPGATGSVIRRNMVRDGLGGGAGWPEHTPSAHGIYLDDGSHDISVDSNVCVGNGASGLFLHNTQRVEAVGNFLAGNHGQQVRFQHDGIAGPGDMMDNRMVANTLVSLPRQELFSAAIGQPQPMEPTIWLENVRCSDARVQVTCRHDGDPTWSRRRVSDTASFLGPQIQAATAVGNWAIDPSTVRIADDPRLATGLRIADPAKKGSMLFSGKTFAVGVGDPWIVSFWAKGGRWGQLLYPVVRRSGGDYAGVGELPTIVLDTVWTEYVHLFRATQAEAKARLDFHGTDSVYWIDQISVRSIPLGVANALPTALVQVNATGTSTTTSFQGRWLDVHGNDIALLAVGPKSAGVAFQLESTGVAAGSVRPRSSLRMVAGAGGLRIDGATETVTVLDARGATLARLEPPRGGHLLWTPPRTSRLVWVRHGQTTRAIPFLR